MKLQISVLAICLLQTTAQSANAQCHPGHHQHKVQNVYYQVVARTNPSYNLPPARFATLSRSSASWSQLASLPIGYPIDQIWRGAPFYRGQALYGEPLNPTPVPLPYSDQLCEMPPQVPYGEPALCEMPPQVPYGEPALCEMPPQVPYGEPAICEMPPQVPYSQAPSQPCPVPMRASSGF